MKYCRNCGQQVRDNSRYCSNCGECFLKEDFSVKEESIKFCQACGSKIVKRYCPHCGKYAKRVSLVIKKGLFAGIFKSQPKWQQNGF